MSNSHNLISSNRNDLIASAGKSLVGAVPFVGPLLSELVDTLIPNQRIDRLTKYVTELEKRLANSDEESLRQRMKEDESISLMEDGYIHASRAITDERRAYIAAIVANGISDENIKLHDSKYLLGLLSELNDTEIIWLRFYLDPTVGGDEEFRAQHANILEPAHSYIGAPEPELDKSALQKSYREHLERLGLIRSHIRIDRNTDMPEFDKISGKPAVSYRSITQLGRMLLREIDMLDEVRS
ncbi:hypothetical protein [uncultured Photobacterium sp.]|uniref:hypothetical protein n=1 Tax=uncultured Photobacterium sp. TaxID=173973 RepID=UPI0026339C80|nr:hypothetical protein [uncultured Photobacterium sp.]